MKLAIINTEPEYELDTVLGIIIDEQEKRTKESIEDTVQRLNVKDIAEAIKEKCTRSYTNYYEDGTPFEDYEITCEIRLADYDQLEPILEYLLVDKYVHCNNQSDTVHSRLYYVTFKGRKFNADGGYRGEKKRKNEEKARIISLEEHHKTIETSIFYLTVILAAVGVIDAVLHVLEIREKDRTVYSFVYTGLQAIIPTAYLCLFWNYYRKNKV